MSHLWRTLVLVSTLLWGQSSMGQTCTYTGPTSVAVAANLAASAAAGTLIWRSPTQTTRFRCVSSSAFETYARLHYNSSSTLVTDTFIDPKQLVARIVWSVKYIVPTDIVGTSTGQVDFNTASLTNLGPNFEHTASVGVNQRAMIIDFTWHVELFVGSAPTAIGLAALPNNADIVRLAGYYSAEFSDNTAPLRLTGLNTIQLIPTTCSINAGAVTMPKVSVNRLNAVGQTGRDAPVAIQLSNCTEGKAGAVTNGRNVRAYFDGPMVDAASGRLNVDDATRNVQIQLRNDNTAQTVINLGGSNGTQNVDTTQINAGSATLRYLARYYATGAATAGAANSRVSFTLEYP